MGKKSKAPPPPDYAALAKQQADLAKTTAQEQTVTNRPNQNTAFGSTKWAQDPTSGQWTQNVTLNPEDQKALDAQRAFDLQRQGVASGALDRAGQSLQTPLSLEGLPEAKGIDESKLGAWGDVSSLDPGFGAVEQVQQAMMGRMAPQRSQAREAEIQRLKNQGLTENSEAFQRAVKRLDEGDTDAQQQALLKAMGAYGDIFNRGLGKAGAMTGQRGEQVGEQMQSSQLASMLRGRGLQERETVRQSPLNDFLKLTQGVAPESGPQMPSFASGTPYQAADMAGAADKTYQAQLDAFNAAKARKGGMMGGLGTLAGGAAGAFFGGPAGAMLGAKLGGAAGGMMGG